MKAQSNLYVALCVTALASAPAAGPMLGKSPRYCNPLPMVSGGGTAASGDVTVIRDHGKYYMYCTGGGAWVSDDLLHWTLLRVANVPVAPDVVKYNGVFCMCGNSGPLLKAENPLGPFTKVGDSGSVPVSINKVRAMNALSRSSIRAARALRCLRCGQLQRHVVGAEPRRHAPDADAGLRLGDAIRCHATVHD